MTIKRRTSPIVFNNKTGTAFYKGIHIGYTWTTKDVLDANIVQVDEWLIKVSPEDREGKTLALDPMQGGHTLYEIQNNQNHLMRY